LNPKKETSIFNKFLIWGVGLGCENENIAQGRSYLDKNVDISDCNFVRT